MSFDQASFDLASRAGAVAYRAEALAVSMMVVHLRKDHTQGLRKIADTTGLTMKAVKAIIEQYESEEK